MNTFQQEEEEGFDFKGLLSKFYDNWYFFILSLAIALSVGYVYNQYLVPSYSVSTNVLLKEKGNHFSGLESLLNEDGATFSKDLVDEFTRLKSPQLMEKVIDTLNLQVSYFVHGKLKRLESYKKNPFIVYTNYEYLPANLSGKYVYLKPLSGFSFQLESADGDELFDHSTGEFVSLEQARQESTTMIVGRKYNLDSTYLQIVLNPNYKSLPQNDGSRYCFLIQEKEILAEDLSKKLTIKKESKSSSIVIISTEGKLIKKEVDILNTLISVYTINNLREKNRALLNTLNFVDEQIAEVSDTLKIIEDELNLFRKNNKLVLSTSMSSDAFAKLKEIDDKRVSTLSNQRYYIYLQKYIINNDPLEKIVAPSMIGIEEPLVSKLVGDILNAANERNRMSLYQEAANPEWEKMNKRINFLRKNILEVLYNNLKNTKDDLAELDRKYRNLEQEAIVLPDKEREFLKIERKLKIREDIYTFLLQKRTEMGMSKAGSVPDVMVIDPAKIRNASIIGLKKKDIYSTAALIGLLLPAAILYLTMLLNDKIQSKKDIEQIVKIPIVGMVGHNRRSEYLVVNENSKSIITEAFRSIRLNLTYFAPDKKNKVIGVTSSVSGEGKTFFTMNLAAVYALAGKKTVVVMSDLRKPKYEAELGLDLMKGLSTYLTGQSNYEESVQATKVKNLYIIPAGPIPPNPAETLGLPSMELLIERLRKEYEYVIIDTPPLGLLADWFIMSQFIDAGVYIVRHNYTRKPLLKKLSDLYKEKKVVNMSIVINDISQKSAGYGYGYGSYGYDYGYSYFEKPESKLQALFNIFKRKNK